MGKSLVIVESPAKIKTLQKIMGPKYVFESSVGHIRDLPTSAFGIDIEHNFEPVYEVLEEKQDVVKKLQTAAKSADTVFLCTDPDREGEAIAWHIASILPEGANIKRATFNSLTKDVVTQALNTPRTIDMHLVDAQQARRLLDRIVGYKISPILARRIKRGKQSEGSLSAGRVQSVALKLVVDREKEIQAFKPVEYWVIETEMQANKGKFSAHIYSIDDKRLEKEPVEGKDVALISDQQTAEDIVSRLKNSTFKVSSIDKKEKRRNPVPPFITSTLQQEASRHHRFSSSKTMSIAQGLYEGIDLGQDGREGLITYMRTDSTRIAPEALEDARKFILNTYGKDYLPDQPKVYKTSKNAQDAHEAIRPANLAHTPESVQAYLSPEQFQLYTLIWQRFIASQMNPAVYDTVACDIEASKGIVLRGTGSTMKFRGFLAAYEEKEDESPGAETDKKIPEMTEGEILKLLALTHEQSFTRPPARYTEASLVKELESCGIGRPSTYTAIMNKIQSRDYTTKENMRLRPTELGCVIAQMLETNFQRIMDPKFTAQMEDELENVADGHKDWHELIRDFWVDFIPTVELAEKEAFVPKIMTEIPCPKCQKPLQKIWSRSKYFYGCSGYPDCDYTAPIEEMSFNKADYDPNFNWEQPCPICAKSMKVRYSRFGPFLGCENYPECKGTVSIPKVGEESHASTEVAPCPAIGCDGKILRRKSRFGKFFYSCSNYPDCNVIVNNVEDLETKYVNHPKTPYVKKGKKGAKKKTTTKKTTKTTAAKKTTTKKATGRTSSMPDSALSAELQAVVGAASMPRTEVTKKVWDYIRTHNLQDAKDKRVINPDATLAPVLGSEPINMFKMTAAIAKHIHKKDD